LNFALLIFMAKPDAEVVVSHHLLNFPVNVARIYICVNATDFPELYYMLMHFQLVLANASTQ